MKTNILNALKWKQKVDFRAADVLVYPLWRPLWEGWDLHRIFNLPPYC